MGSMPVPQGDCASVQEQNVTYLAFTEVPQRVLSLHIQPKKE